jgi:hypothetical protein
MRRTSKLAKGVNVASELMIRVAFGRLAMGGIVGRRIGFIVDDEAGVVSVSVGITQGGSRHMQPWLGAAALATGHSMLDRSKITRSGLNAGYGWLAKKYGGRVAVDAAVVGGER